jgi:Arc/MetJ family transcription regulator
MAGSCDGGAPCVWRDCGQVYSVGVIKRTNINLDMDLVKQAAHELGTKRTTDTVHEALRGVVARSRRARLAEREFEDLTPDALDALRRPAGRAA